LLRSGGKGMRIALPVDNSLDDFHAGSPGDILDDEVGLSILEG
jgi:hypothetical protein